MRRRWWACASAVAALACLACPRARQEVVYDLAAQAPFAERWSAREAVLFGAPGSEPYLAEGFYAEGWRAAGEPAFLWARQEAELAFHWPAVEERAAVVELAPYPGLRGQSVEVRLNGVAVARWTLNEIRHRYRLGLPAARQRAGDNRLRFVFTQAAAPAEADPASGDTRRLAAAFSLLSVSAAGDANLDDLLRRSAPAPFEASTSDGLPTLTLQAPAVVRFTLRLPAGAELRFTPELHPQARASASAAAFRVTVEGEQGSERELYARVLRAADGPAAEVVLPLPGASGSIVRLGLGVGGAPSERLAWGVWRAPRVLGRAGAPGGRLQPPAAGSESASGAVLRQALQDSHVIFVILDAARARQFGAYGYARATTPEIDRLAREGVVFERAFTPAVYTLSAMSSVWTSQYPDRHHGRLAFSSPLPAERFTLAELLSARGIATAGFVANAMAGRAFGLHQGFGEFHELFRDLGSDADAFMQVVPGWLDRQRAGRFFLYLHFREPHFPFDPRPPYDTAFGPDGPIPRERRRDARLLVDANQGRRPLSATEHEHLVRLYDGNLAFADHELGRLRQALVERGLWERSVLIVAADHGEALGEHGYIGHNAQVYEESTHVPLIVRLPRGLGRPGTRVTELVDLLDVAPTVAEVFGLQTAAEAQKSFQGRSLLALLAGGPGKPAVLSRTVWDRPRYALRDERYKLIYDTRTGEQELYDLQADPGERRNLSAMLPLRAAFYRQELHQWLAGLVDAGAGAGGTGAAKLTREQCENLKALGYLGADTACPAE